MKYTPRNYQNRIIDSVIEELGRYTKPFVVDSFQASGKSLMIAELVRRLEEPVLVLCMSKELVEQDRDKLVDQGVNATMYSASTGEKIISDVTVATIQSIYTIPEFCERFGLVIIDEADSLPADNPNSMYMKFLSKLKVKVVGWTGTPFRIVQRYGNVGNDVVYQSQIRALNRIPMGKNGFFWGKIIHGISYNELREEKYVAPIQYMVQATDHSMLRVNSTGANYTDDSLKEFGDTNRGLIARVTANIARNYNPKRILVAVPNIEDAVAIADSLQNIVPCAVLHSKMKKKERTDIINKFRSGEIKAVIQVMILNVGFDLPCLDWVIFARPSLSLRIWCQFVARGIRLDPDDRNKVCKVVDMAGMIEKFGRIEDVRTQKEAGGFRTEIHGTYGKISDKVIAEVNMTQITRQKVQPKLYN